MLVLLMALTATIFVIMVMQVDELKYPVGRLFSFTTLPDNKGNSLVFEVWAHDYTHALKMAYKYRVTHLENLDKTVVTKWAKIQELDPTTKEVIDTIIDRETVSEKVSPETNKA